MSKELNLEDVTVAELLEALQVVREARRPKPQPQMTLVKPKRRKAVSDMMTVLEVAEALNVHRSTVYSLIRSGDMPFLKVGSTYRIPRGDFGAWVAEQDMVKGA